MYIMCMLFQRFEPQGRLFTNFHYIHTYMKVVEQSGKGYAAVR